MADEDGYEQVERSITIEKDVPTVYARWAQFERFPDFMDGVERVERLSDTRLRWAAQIGPATREWEADVVEHDPERLIVWEADGEVRHDGRVSFVELAPNRTEVTLRMCYAPEGFVEKAAAAVGIVESRVEGDLERFKELLEGDGEG